MSTRPETVTHLLEVLAPAGALAARKMFGEYGLYLDGKIVGLICNDRLYIKPTPGAVVTLPDVPEAPPYPGARLHLAPDAALDDPAPVIAALRAAWTDLPKPPPKRARR